MNIGTHIYKQHEILKYWASSAKCVETNVIYTIIVFFVRLSLYNYQFNVLLVCKDGNTLTGLDSASIRRRFGGGSPSLIL